MAPCPSTNVLDIGTDRVQRTVSPDISELDARQRREIEQVDGLYRGSLVVKGAVVEQVRKFLGESRSLSVLVVKSIERPSTQRERKLCSSKSQ